MMVEKKQDILQRNLLKFYANDVQMKKLCFLLSKNSDVSLREWDFLCTHYTKTHNVLYYIENSIGKRELINLNMNYRSQLKAYSKANFDPFKRHNRITVPCKYADTKTIETTCGQLCFFKFVIEKDMYEWLKKSKNLENLRHDMNQYSKKRRTSTQVARSVSNNSVSTPKGNKSISRHDVNITVFF